MAFNVIQPPANTGQAGAKYIRVIDITEISGPQSGSTVEMQIVCLGDPTTAANQAAVVLIHTGFNQTIPAGGSVLTSGVAALQNNSGKLDPSLEAGADGIPARGIPATSGYLAQRFALTTCSASVSSSGSAVNIAVSSSTGFVVGGEAIVDTVASGVQETQYITAIPDGTHITVDHLNNSHNGTVTPFPIQMYVFNQAKDAAGELDIGPGIGASMAVGYVFDGVTYTRERSITSLGRFTTTTNGSITASTNQVVITLNVAPPSNTPIGSPLEIIDGASSEQCQITAINVGAKTVTVLLLANNHANGTNVIINTQQLNAAPVNAPAFGIPAEGDMLYSGLSAAGDMLVSMHQDINAVNSLSATLNPTVGAATASGIASEVDFGIVFSGLQTYSNATLCASQHGQGGEELMTNGGRTYATLAAGAGTVQAKSGAGRLCRIVFITTGTAATTVQDHVGSGGNTIYTSATAPTAGTVVDLQIPVTAGVFITNVTGSAQLIATVY